MFTRVVVLLVSVVSLSGLLGCVSADVYRLKEQEVVSLHRENEDAQERNKWLLAEKSKLENRSGEMKKENERLNDQIAKQGEEVAYLKDRAERLEKNAEELREKVAHLNSKIEELNTENQKLAVLSRPENLVRSLGERLTDLQKQVEALAGENEQLRSKQAVAPSNQQKADHELKRSEATGEKPEAVLVSSGRQAEAVLEAPLQPEERNSTAISGDGKSGQKDHNR